MVQNLQVFFYFLLQKHYGEGGLRQIKNLKEDDSFHREEGCQPAWGSHHFYSVGLPAPACGGVGGRAGGGLH